MASNKIIGAVIGVVLTVVVVFQIMGGTSDTVGVSAGNLTCANRTLCGTSDVYVAAETYPLVNLFGRGGLVLLLLMIGILVGMIKLMKVGK